MTLKFPLVATDRTSGQRLLAQVTEAVDMLTDYNGRLAGEMDERKRVTRLLQDFTQSQKDLLAQAERSLEVSGGSCGSTW